MSNEEIVECAEAAVENGCGTIVLQSGELPGESLTGIGEVVAEIKRRFGVAVTLSLGERTAAEFRYFRECGADRYLLKFETSDLELYERYHPSHAGCARHRIDLLAGLRDMGYEIGSGNIVGLPGQTWSSVANDLRHIAELDLDMIAIGPWIPHPFTPLGSRYGSGPPRTTEQVPNTCLAARRVVALSRILCPEANIPATAALAEFDAIEYLAALRGGANVVMLDFTPNDYRIPYDIYPSEVRTQNVADRNTAVLRALRASGRSIGSGPGNRIRFPRNRHDSQT